MGFDRVIKTEAPEENCINESLGVIENVVLEEACGASVSQVQPEFSELENIIMEGDIILKVHADGEYEEIQEKDNYPVLKNNGTGEYCMKHNDLFLHCDERLIKPGDMFNSYKEFVQYISDNAKRWCFYYKCTESYNVDTDHEMYIFNCVYLKNKDYKKKSLKKRYNSKTDCPCKIKLKRKPHEDLTVVFVCNHHDHELSQENFNKLVNTKKLPPYIKEVIMDLLSLEVEISKIRKFVEMETNIKMSRAFFYDIERKMKINNEERHISDKRLKELSEKIALVDEMISGDDEDNIDEQGHLKKKRLAKPLKCDEMKKRKKQGSLTEMTITTEDETIQTFKQSLSDAQDSSWTSERNTSQKRRNSAMWDVSSITHVNDEITLQAEDSQEFPDTCDNTYTDDYNPNDYTTTENVDDADADATNVVEVPQEENQYEYQTVVLQDEFGNIINCENDEQIMIIQQDENGEVHGDGETIGYFDGEKIIYVGNEAEVSDAPACDVAVQTSSHTPGHSYVPVFDVYMKEGNVTGFVVNDNLVKQGGAGVEKGVQTPTDSAQEDPEQKLSEDIDEPYDIPPKKATQEIISGDTYTKHEYIHRYNIDQYMTKASFPKYIDTLAKKTRTDVLHMLSRVYNEKAMFKMTTTQRVKEGNTKIWYLTDVRRKGQYKMSDEEKRKRDKIGQYLTDILILKEKVKCLKKENEELVTRNKYLEEVALRLANMRNSN